MAVKVNENYLKVEENYLFSDIEKKVKRFCKQYPEANIIKLGIGDVTLPLVPAVVKAMHKAVDEMSVKETFEGYPPAQGYDFLRQAISRNFMERGVNIDINEIFISDGTKCDISNILDIFGLDNKVAIATPVYPVYVDTNIMLGRKDSIVYMPINKENNYVPELPKEKVDIIYLCLPNNPTGTVLKKEELKKFVDYALDNKSIILFDAAYESFIREEDIPHSIYEIPGAEKVCIEFRSFSKSASFTGVRCGYTVLPKQVLAYTEKGEKIQLNKLWARRMSTKFNGVSYIVQRGAEAVYTKEGKKQIKASVDYYLRNVKILKDGLIRLGYTVYGGVNSPYIWLKVPEKMTSWEFFDFLLEKANIVGTPGVGFGESGEGYFRLTGFGTKEDSEEAIRRIEKITNK